MPDPTFSHSSHADQQALAPQGPARWRWPWLPLLGALALLIALRFSALSGNAGGRDGLDGPGIGTKLTQLDLQPLTGNPDPVSLADLEGKVTLINFWGPWCGYCVVEFPHLVELEKHLRAEPDFQLLSVSSNPDPSDERGLAESTKSFLMQQRAEFPTYRDPGGQSTRALAHSAGLQQFGYPTTVVLDRNALIRGVWIGFRPGDERGMQQLIERVLQATEPSHGSSIEAEVSKAVD